MYYSNNSGSFVPVNQNKQVNFPNIPSSVIPKTQNETQDQSKKYWTQEEDKKLKQLVEQYGKDWDKISEEMPGRTSGSCESRYYYFIKPMENPSTLRKDRFTKEEDERLKQLVEHLGEEDFVEIAKNMPGRTPRQCRNRWKNHLSPDVNNNSWTQEENELLITKYQELGTAWAKIAYFFENRTVANLRNHFYYLSMKEKRGILKNQSNNAIPTSSQQISDATPILLQQTFNAFNATPIPLQQTFNAFNATPTSSWQTSPNLPETPKETQENNSPNNITLTPLQQTVPFDYSNINCLLNNPPQQQTPVRTLNNLNGAGADITNIFNNTNLLQQQTPAETLNNLNGAQKQIQQMFPPTMPQKSTSC